MASEPGRHRAQALVPKLRLRVAIQDITLTGQAADVIEELLAALAAAEAELADAKRVRDLMSHKLDESMRDGVALHKENARLRAALEQVECVRAGYVLYCPWCGAEAETIAGVWHKPHCPRQSALGTREAQ